MPRITIENKKEIGGGVSEIVPVTYELPEKIVVGGEMLYWDPYHAGYWLRSNEEFISGKDYLKEVLEAYNGKSKDEK